MTLVDRKRKHSSRSKQIKRKLKKPGGLLAHHLQRAVQPERRAMMEKAEVFASQCFDDGSGLVSLTKDETATINTMIDFFRASGEQEHLDPEVYEAIAEKLGNGRKTPREALVGYLKKLEDGLWTLGVETVGDEGGEHRRVLADSAQKDLHELSKGALRVATALSSGPFFLLYDTTVAREGETGELIGIFTSLAEAQKDADNRTGRTIPDKNGYQHAIDEWHSDQLVRVRHHFRDAYDVWTSEQP